MTRGSWTSRVSPASAASRLNNTTYVHTRNWDIFRPYAEVSPSSAISQVENAIRLDVVVAKLEREVEKQKEKELKSTDLIFSLDTEVLFPAGSGNDRLAALHRAGKARDIESRVAFLNAIVEEPIRDMMEDLDNNFDEASQAALDIIAAAFEGKDNKRYDRLNLSEKGAFVKSIVQARDAILKEYENSSPLVQFALKTGLPKVIGAAEYYQNRYEKELKQYSLKNKKRAAELEKLVSSLKRVSGGTFWANDKIRTAKDKERSERNMAKIATSIENSAKGHSSREKSMQFENALGAYGGKAMEDTLKNVSINDEIEVVVRQTGREKNIFGQAGKQDLSIIISQQVQGKKVEESLLRISAKLKQAKGKTIKVHEGGGIKSYARRIKSSSIFTGNEMNFVENNAFMYTYGNLLFNDPGGMTEAVRGLIEKIGFSFIGIDALKGDLTGADFLAVNERIVPFSRVLENLLKRIRSGSKGGANVSVSTPGSRTSSMAGIVPELWSDKRFLRGQGPFYNDAWVGRVASRGEQFINSRAFTISLTMDLLGL